MSFTVVNVVEETSMAVAGIDGCRGGWFAIKGNTGNWSFQFASEIANCFENSVAKCIFIDIPIGLSSTGFNREVDAYARKELSPHKTSSIFTPPVREALWAKDYTHALEANRAITGKGISIQSWNISPKIIEVEELLLSDLKLKNLTYEAHPEICFKYLNQGEVIVASKKSPEGRRERYRLLERLDSTLVKVVDHAMKTTQRKSVAQDDILDAAVLALCASYASGDSVHLVGNYCEIDEAGLPVRIGFGVP